MANSVSTEAKAENTTMLRRPGGDHTKLKRTFSLLFVFLKKSWKPVFICQISQFLNTGKNNHFFFKTRLKPNETFLMPKFGSQAASF